MNNVRIWFNHWFSTVFHIINLLKEDTLYSYTVIGSNENEVSVYKQVCDEWYREPLKLSDEEYVEFCLEFCKEHSVDVFAPRKKLDAVSKNHLRFEQIGVKLLVDSDFSTVKILDNKVKTYEYLQDKVPECMPDRRVARSFDDFIKYYEELSPTADRVCYKLALDEGARSFRVIDNRIESSDYIFEKPGCKITFEAAKKVLKDYDFSNPVLMMPYLGGVEVSVDCLATNSGNMIFPRFKTNKRYSEIIFDEEITDICNRLMDVLKLTAPLNIQFKKDNERYYLLEINPRMSGGVPLTCKATGINIPLIAVNKLLGNDVEWKYPDWTSRKVVHIETPVCF